MADSGNSSSADIGVGQDGRGISEQERAACSRNSAGSEISGIDWLIVTIKVHNVVFDSAVNLYCTSRPPAGPDRRGGLP